MTELKGGETVGLYKRGQVWWMRFTYKGAVVRQSTETQDGQLAERIYHKVLGQIAEGKWFDRLPEEEKTFRELIQRYLSDHSARNKAISSHRRDKSLAEQLSRFFGTYTLAEISPKLIAAYKMKRRASGASPKTVNSELTLMSHAFTLGMKEWEWVRDNPVRKVSREKVRNTVERWLTLGEEKQLLEVSIPWLRAIIVFAIHTGLRQSEILNLQWSQVDLFRRTITLLEQKNGCKDTLPVNGKALDVLKDQARLWQQVSPYVFPNTRGKRRGNNNLLRGFYRARKRANLTGFRFHDLRHTFATRLVQAGVDLYTVQKLGRWKTISMVMRYAHHHAESLRAGIEVLERVKEPSSTNLAQSSEIGAAACG